MSDEESEWWKPLYDDLLASALLEESNGEELEQTVDFLISALQLRPGSTLFDQCCGTGRMALAFAKRGYRVTGVDLTEAYIERARVKADHAKLSIDFHTGDAFVFSASPLCDGAVNWWTSFGYADDARNLTMLQRAFESLKPGSRFALDFINAPGLYRAFQPSVITRASHRDGSFILLRESELDLAGGVIRKLWTYVLENGKRVIHRSSVRLYDPHTLGEILGKAGFSNIHFFGDHRGGKLTIESPRCIAIGEKPH